MQQPHDRGYRTLFTNVELVQQLLESFVHESWVKDIDFSQASLFDTSIISPVYQKTESDVIWRLPLYSGSEIYLLLLLEFQSKVDPFMAFRMLQYIIQIYHSLRKQNPKLTSFPPVFPVVLYNGEKPWTAPVQFADLVYPQIGGTYIPQFQYFKLAENEFKREELLRLKNLISALFLIETSTVEEYPSTIEQIVDILEKVSPDLYKEIVRWLWHTIGQEAPPELDKLPRTKEVPTMLAAELQREREAIRQQSLLEGLQKGKLEGKFEGKLEGILENKKETARKLKARGMAVQDIADITGLSIEMIQSL
jgi:predicted transposase YdaD